MKILVVTEMYPWPAADGARHRLSQLVAGLAAVGDVDLVSLVRPEHPEPSSPPEGLLAGCQVVRTGADPGSPGRWWRWLTSPTPRRVLAIDWSGAVELLSGRRGEGHDLVWYSQTYSWWATHHLFPGVPAIADLYDLVDVALRRNRGMRPSWPDGASVVAQARTSARWAAAQAADLLDEGRWRRLQLDCARSVDRVTVCSELDGRRLGVPNVAVVPNGCETPAAPMVDRTRLRGARPTLGFVGALDYRPNAEAVEWFVQEVLPLIRSARPDVRLRVVGRGAERLSGLGSRPGVELAGRVEDLRAELEATDVSVVPIRIGAGTRLKVVEALANHLPLVTTTVGCEGIDVVDGESALVADDAGAFARACVRALDDGGLRQRLADRGAELFAERYSWSRIRSEVGDLARTVAGVRRPV